MASRAACTKSNIKLQKAGSSDESEGGLDELGFHDGSGWFNQTEVT